MQGNTPLETVWTLPCEVLYRSVGGSALDRVAHAYTDLLLIKCIRIHMYVALCSYMYKYLWLLLYVEVSFQVSGYLE